MQWAAKRSTFQEAAWLRLAELTPECMALHKQHDFRLSHL